MHRVINFLLIIIGLSISIGKSDPLTESNIENMIPDGESITACITGLKQQKLQLMKGGKLGKTDHAIVWKGRYNDNKTVAVKITWDKKSMDDEMRIFLALNATKDPNIESHKVPRIFYFGNVLGQYNAIAMTLFDGTLEDRYKYQNEQPFTVFNVLVIFKQAMEALKYIHSRNVLHNDIKPENLFLRGTQVFIGDFDLSTLDGEQNWGHTPTFASSGYYQIQDRHEMDDLESLIFSIWYIAGVPMCRSDDYANPEGYVLYKCFEKGNGQAEARMQEKCSFFNDECVQKAFKIICVDEICSRKKKPNYERIIDALNEAINLTFAIMSSSKHYNLNSWRLRLPSAHNYIQSIGQTIQNV